MKRLYTRIYFHFVGVLVVVGLLTSAVFSLGQRGAFWREVTQRMSRHLSSVLGEGFADPALQRSMVQHMHEDFELDLTVHDPQGRILVTAGDPLPALLPSELSRLRAGRDVLRGHPYFSVVAPIQDRQRKSLLGYLEIAPPHRYRAFSLTAISRPLLAVALVLALLALATAPLARRISQPVERLTEAMRRLGAGELSYRIPLVAMTNLHRHRRRSRLDQMQQLLSAWNDMADRIERLLRGQKELLANISHELRSPLARVRVALELLPRDGDSDARIAEVEADLLELERLISDVLMSSRLEATGLSARPQEVGLLPLLQEVQDRAGHDPLTKNSQIQVEVDASLTVEADGPLLRRALFNLIENAAKYGAPPILLTAQPSVSRPGVIEIAVTDQGEGIPIADRERVFEPFYRGDKARTPHNRTAGFGLGLTLARRVAEAHGGSIEISSLTTEPGRPQGCRVTLQLPRYSTRV